MRLCFKDGMYVESARSQCVYVNAIINRPREEGWGGVAGVFHVIAFRGR